jgi:UDP-N-acetylglucosamine--N-acetylmuramyl-(pentapeptide) pyrophosphoryl-undecaprenol N-acetylglucosamine transferase
VGTGRPAEGAILDPLGYDREILAMSGLKGQGALRIPGALWRAAKALLKAVDLVRSFKPDLGVVTGGYVGGPVGLALKLGGTPLVVHEQNSRPGLTNRLLGLLADRVLVAFPEAAGGFAKAKTRLIGNPVRGEIAQVGILRRAGGLARSASRPPTILILGGSQGSRRLNQAAVALVAQLAGQGMRLSVIHQSGAAMEAETARAYLEMGVEAETRAFISDMAEAYQRSDLAIARAGALTVFELAAARLPAVLVPLPTAADDHQSHNAKALAAAGLAVVVREADLEAGALVEAAGAVLRTPGRLAAMSGAELSGLKAMGEDAELAGELTEVIGGGRVPQN